MRVLVYVLVCLTALARGACAADDGNMLSRFLEDTLSGDNRSIKVTGLKGALSSHATMQKLTVSDDQGVWLTMTGVVLDWNRLALARGRFSVNTLSAEEIDIARPPGKTTTPTELPAPETQPFALPELPVSIELGEISVPRLVLGEPVLGVAAELDVNGALTLADGALDTTLALTRIDRPGDAARLLARYANDTRRIQLDLSVVEAAGGLISAALNMPDRPPLNLTARGDGPVTDFTADLTLASDGVDRVAGQVRLRAEPASGPAPAADATGPGAQGITFSARMAGDVTPFLPPDYRAFFGPDTRLDLTGLRAADGRLDLSDLAIASDALHLKGALAMAANGQIELVRLTGGIDPPSGDEVVLPISGPRTTVGRLDLAVTLDRSVGDDWTLNLALDRLTRPDLLVESARLAGRGVVGGSAGNRIRGTVTGTLAGVAPTDPALARAVGQSLALSGQFAMTGADALQLDRVELHGADYRANVDGTIRGLSTGFQMQGKARVAAADLSRFSGLAGHQLGGAATARVEGNGAPLSGSFDIRLGAATRDLRTGIEQADALTAGDTTLTLDVARGAGGLEIRSFRLTGAELTAKADGILRSADSALRFHARLADLAKLAPQLDGPLTASGDLRRRDAVWTGGIRLDGPHSSRARLDASVKPDGSAKMTFDAELARLERLLPDLAGALTASGTADRGPDGVWAIAASAKGPADLATQVDGTWNEAAGRADLNARGRMRLNFANPFLSPNSIDGSAAFDLTLSGAPSLDTVSGTITTSGATFAVPSAVQTVKDLEAKITIARSKAQVATSGTLGSGGSFRVSGPVALAPPFEGRIAVDLNALGLTDNFSYFTSVGGQLVYAGPLGGDGTLSGHMEFGETDINLNTVAGSAGTAPIPPITHRAEPSAVRATRARAGLVETDKTGGGPVLGLDITLAAHNRVYAHGFGIEAEMGGDISVGGTTQQVVPSGQIELIRGSVDVLGRRLKLTKGVISLLGDLKPYVEFQSSTNTSEGVATMEISGPINAPEVEVFAEPERPAEEALAMLLFGNRFSELSPLVIAQMAASLARMRGGGGNGAPRDVKDATGADTVRAGSSASGGGLLGAGGYLSQNVYTDFTVNTDGETELNLNLDLSDSVTVKGTVDNAGETAIGLFYSHDY